MKTGIVNTCSICGKQFRRLWQDDICPLCSYSMEPQQINLKEMREQLAKEPTKINGKKKREQLAKRKASAERKRKLVIENLSRERFCEVLDSLTPPFKFNLKNVREDFGLNGYWEKIILDGQTMWHKDGRYLPSSSLFTFKEQVFEAIERKNRKVLSKFYRKNDSPKDNSIRTRRRRGEITPILNKEKLKELYLEQNKSLEDIAKEYGTSRQNVLKIMRGYGLIRRTQSTARVEAIKKGKFENLSYADMDEKFFSKWSPGMAWALGLLFTDGHIHANMVQFTSVDLDLLERVRTLLKSSGAVQKRMQGYDKSKHIYVLAFSHPKIAEDLRKMGLHESKSLDMAFPEVPEEYMRHFIRGCWDGDGSIFFTRNRLEASYVTGSKNFIEKLVHELFKIGIFKNIKPYHLDHKGVGYRYVKKYSPMTDEFWSKYADGRFPLTVFKHKGANAYYIKIRGKENIEKLFHYFYDGVDESMYLSRKYEVFVKGLNFGKKEATEQLTLDLDS